MLHACFPDDQRAKAVHEHVYCPMAEGGASGAGMRERGAGDGEGLHRAGQGGRGAGTPALVPDCSALLFGGSGARMHLIQAGGGIERQQLSGQGHVAAGKGSLRLHAGVDLAGLQPQIGLRSAEA